MKTLKVNLNRPSPSIIQKAARVIVSGGLVIHPTDTCYGIAANALDPKAIQKVYAVKGRDFNKPLIACVRDLVMASKLVELNPLAERLFKKFLPGPLTIVLPKRPLVPDILTPATLGIRIPDCPVTLALSKICPVPYTTTSANISGQPNSYSVAEISKEVREKCGLALDSGVLPLVPPSTVVYITGGNINILREGPISLSQLLS